MAHLLFSCPPGSCWRLIASPRWLVLLWFASVLYSYLLCWIHKMAWEVVVSSSAISFLRSFLLWLALWLEIVWEGIWVFSLLPLDDLITSLSLLAAFVQSLVLGWVVASSHIFVEAGVWRLVLICLILLLVLVRSTNLIVHLLEDASILKIIMWLICEVALWCVCCIRLARVLLLSDFVEVFLDLLWLLLGDLFRNWAVTTWAITTGLHAYFTAALRR